MIKYLKDSFKTYLKFSDNPVDKNKYLKVSALYNKFLIEKALNGDEIVIPLFGTISLVGREQKARIEDGKVVGLAPDWVTTKKLWKENEEARLRKQLVYHTNDHTEGVRYRWHWSKKNAMIENKSLYALQMSRANKRAVHKAILEGKQFVTRN